MVFESFFRFDSQYEIGEKLCKTKKLNAWVRDVKYAPHWNKLIICSDDHLLSFHGNSIKTVGTKLILDKIAQHYKLTSG